VRGDDGVVEYVNRRFLEYSGLPQEQAVDPGALCDVVHPEDQDAFLDLWWGREPAKELRMRRAADGECRWQLGRTLPIREDDGRVLRWFGTITDIHDQKVAEEAAREAHKFESIGLLAGGIAHDFNDLLTSILGNASLLGIELPAERKPRLAAIITATEKAADLTRQLLAYAGKGRFLVEPVDISRVVREIADLLHASIPKKVRLVQELAADLPPVDADRGQIQQIVMNLVLNAAESIPEGRAGSVVLSTRNVLLPWRGIRGPAAALQPGEYVCIEVRDTGCGMDERTKARIFDPFFTTKFTGRGLGLPAVAGVVKAHAGAIEVESKVGQGTVFRVYLPAGTGQREPEPRRVETPAGGGATVLVIDDEPMVREVVAAALGSYGYSVLTAVDGRDGVRTFTAHEDCIDAVVLDLTMPEMDGREAEAALRAVRPDVKIIAMSGYSETEARRLFSGSRLSAFIQKPFPARRIAEVVREVLDSA
jgi:PAS domain S-box-containing protein